MLKGFKEFLMKGNVVDLATAVVVGAAFTAIVKAFTDGIINPLIARIGGKGELGLGFQIGDKGNPETFVNIGTVITAAIDFLIIAAVVYFIIIMPYEKLKSLRAAEGEETQTEQELLAEIRDLLSGKDPKAAKAVDQAKAAGALSEADGNLGQLTGSNDQSAQPPVTQHFSAPGGFNTPEPFGTSETYGAAPTATAEPPRASAEPVGSAPERFGSNPADSLTGTGPQPFGGSNPEPLTGTGPQPFGGRAPEPLTGTGPQPFGGAPDRFGAPPERFDAPRPSGPPSGSFPAQPPSGSFPAQSPSGPPSGAFQAPSGPTIVPPQGGPSSPPPQSAPRPGDAPRPPSEWNPQATQQPSQPPQPPQGPPPGAGNADPFGTTRMGGIDPAAGGARPDPRGPARDQFGRPIEEGYNGPDGPQGQQGPTGGQQHGGQHGRHQQ